MRRRGTPELLVATLILVLIGWYIWYTHSVIVELRADAQRSTAMYARVYHAISDTTRAATNEALFDLSRSITEQGVPLIVIDPQNVVSAHANLPFDTPNPVLDDDPRVKNYVSVLAQQHAPIVDTLIG